MTEHDDDKSEKPNDEGSFAGRVPDMFRKAIMGSVGAVLLTEEGVRSSLSDKIPKDAMGYLVTQVDKTKREVVNSLARELRLFLQELELQDVMKKALEGTTFEINTTIRVLHDEEGNIGAEVLKKSVKKTSAAEETPEPKAKKKAKKAKRKTTKKKKASKKNES